MSQATKATKSEDVVLPEEHFWRCYSSRGELPLSGMVSLTLHALAFGALIFGGVLAAMLISPEKYRPPRMDVIEVEGFGGGDGGIGGPGAAGPVGSGQRVTKTETAGQVQPNLPQTNNVVKPPAAELVKNVAPNALHVPREQIVEDKTPETADVFASLQAEAKQLSEARQAVADSMKVPVAELATTGSTGGGAGGGGRGGPVGPGRGNNAKVPEGMGTDPSGQKLTKTQRREMRWEVDFAGTGQEHLKKLQALHILLAVPTPQPGLFRVYDFSGPVPQVRPDNLSGYKDKVKWFNVHPPSLQELAGTLRLQYVPQYVVIFLPSAVEEEMARLEVEYRNVPEPQIRYTKFEIRLRSDGSYGPVVVEQQVRSGEGAPPAGG